MWVRCDYLGAVESDWTGNGPPPDNHGLGLVEVSVEDIYGTTHKVQVLPKTLRQPIYEDGDWYLEMLFLKAPWRKDHRERVLVRFVDAFLIHPQASDIWVARENTG